MQSASLIQYTDSYASPDDIITTTKKDGKKTPKKTKGGKGAGRGRGAGKGAGRGGKTTAKKGTPKKKTAAGKAAATAKRQQGVSDDPTCFAIRHLRPLGFR